MLYYPVARNWTSRALPHLGNRRLNRILVRDFNRYTWGRWKKPFTLGMFPARFDCGDWRYLHRGPAPRFWRYVSYHACFWLVNFNLHLAQLMEPHRPWRIVWSEQHATVWDGDWTLFDLNFIALEVTTADCWRLANVHHLGVGERYRPGYPVFWRDEVAARQALIGTA